MSNRKASAALRKPVVREDDEFPVESGIQITDIERAKQYDFGFDKLKIGQSKFIKLHNPEQEGSLRSTVTRYARHTVEKSSGEIFLQVRKMLLDPKQPESNKNPMGFRVFRTEA